MGMMCSIQEVRKHTAVLFELVVQQYSAVVLEAVSFEVHDGMQEYRYGNRPLLYGSYVLGISNVRAPKLFEHSLWLRSRGSTTILLLLCCCKVAQLLLYTAVCSVRSLCSSGCVCTALGVSRESLNLWYLFPNHVGERSRMSPMMWPVDLCASFCDHKRIWYVADDSLVSLAKFSWVAV